MFVRFTFQRMTSIYGSYANYASKVSQSIDRMVKERWVTAIDAQRIRAELIPGEMPASAAKVPQHNR